MQLLEKIEYIVEVFEMLKNPKCDKMFCTTCGGHIGRIEKDISNLFPHNRKIIAEILEVATFSELDKCGIWIDALEAINLDGVISVYVREAKKLDLSDIDAVDRFLLKARKINKLGDTEFSPLYGKILKYAISKAVIDSNESLAETVILSLEDKVKDYPELLQYVLSISRHNNQMKRVLYNFLREYVPEVRSYIGDGSSVFYW